MQTFLQWNAKVLGANVKVIEERKNFAGERNIFQRNANVLRINVNFLGGTKKFSQGKADVLRANGKKNVWGNSFVHKSFAIECKVSWGMFWE